MNILSVYRAQARTTVAIQLQYRVALFIWMIGLVLEPVIYLVVWSTVAQSNGGQVGRYSTSDFAGYFIVLMLVNHATFTWVIFGFDQRVRQGALSPMLLRPIHPIHADVVENLSFKLLMVAVMAPATVALTLTFHPVIHPALWAIAAFIPALVLAMVMRFLVEWSIALVAFWTTRMGAINQMYYVSVLFLSGQVAPLSLFPAPIRAVASVLPFRWMVAFPVELLVGRLSRPDTLIGLGAQVLWLLVALVGLNLLWRAGLARYSAVGA